MSGDSIPTKLWQDAMTSKQVKLTVVLILISGCGLFGGREVEPLASPYPTRHVWAVVPLQNESGSTAADGVALADHLVRQLENAYNLDVLSVNRSLKAMQATGLSQITSPDQAMRLMETLSVDGLVVGTVTLYDPYDPPKLGMAIELYANPRVEQADTARNWDPSGTSAPGSGPSLAGLQRLSWTSTDSRPGPASSGMRQPVSIVSAVFDASDPDVRMGLERFAHDRGMSVDDESWRLYQINMDLYSEFVSYVMSWRLLRAEAQRLAPADPEPAP